MKNKLLPQSFSNISDDELLHRLSALLQSSRRIESELVAHIGEVDQRRLYARFASSMFVYCTEVLHLSEHEAYLRITVARASREHPMLLEMLADGRLHLSGIAKLAPHLTEHNREVVLACAIGKSKREIEELVAELCPKPDVPARMRKLPERREKTKPKSGLELGLDRVERPSSSPSSVKPAVVKPLAPARYKIELTASAELREKLERLQKLVGSADLAAIIDEAVTEKLERLEAKRYGKTKAPRKSLEETDTSASTRYIPAAVKRGVHARDQGRCTYVDVNGRRCTEGERLEFHHNKPFGLGGDHSPGNIRLMCRTHNSHLAEHDYGKDVIERYRRTANRVSEPAVVYTFSNRDTLAHRAVTLGPRPSARCHRDLDAR